MWSQVIFMTGLVWNRYPWETLPIMLFWNVYKKKISVTSKHLRNSYLRLKAGKLIFFDRIWNLWTRRNRDQVGEFHIRSKKIIWSRYIHYFLGVSSSRKQIIFFFHFCKAKERKFKSSLNCLLTEWKMSWDSKKDMYRITNNMNNKLELMHISYKKC